jgi:hypothetical protein
VIFCNNFNQDADRIGLVVGQICLFNDAFMMLRKRPESQNLQVEARQTKSSRISESQIIRDAIDQAGTKALYSCSKK